MIKKLGTKKIIGVLHLNGYIKSHPTKVQKPEFRLEQFIGTKECRFCKKEKKKKKKKEHEEELFKPKFCPLRAKQTQKIGKTNPEIAALFTVGSVEGKKEANADHLSEGDVHK